MTSIPPIGTARDEAATGVKPAGQFRLYLGSVAGVGKTCAMLDEGARRKARGTDVVIGFVETHGRPKTIEMAEGIEVIARKEVSYRGATFTEMDLDAILERAPQVALIDELAHTNVSGSSSHDKRWQDVLALLDAGIAVISTVNIQHLESIADAVESMTGSKVRERVPDWVVRRANQIELIDSSPEQLRRRMLHGNIYPEAKIAGALEGFFQTKNLTALRELALRFVADETDEQLVAFLTDQLDSTVWETRERVLATTTGEDGATSALHRAARMATRLRATFDVVFVETSESSSRSRETLAQLRALAVDLGATPHEVNSDRHDDAILELAHRLQVTQLVISAAAGVSRRGLRPGGPLARLVDRATATGIDVHLIARHNQTTSDRPTTNTS